MNLTEKTRRRDMIERSPKGAVIICDQGQLDILKAMANDMKRTDLRFMAPRYLVMGVLSKFEGDIIPYCSLATDARAELDKHKAKIKNQRSRKTEDDEEAV